MNEKKHKRIRLTNSNAQENIVVDVSHEQEQYNNFYDYISVLYSVISFIIFAAFLLYIVLTAFNNASDFSYENFEYIIRNFALTLNENKDDSFYSIEYTPDANMEYSLFGQGLAVCGNSGISIYSATGRLTCSEAFPYKNPQLVASDKFALVYDFSNSEYSLYNAFSRVYSEKNTEVIRGAAVSDNGYYALITSSEQYNTAVELYDNSFSLINRFNKQGFVVDIDISDKYLMIVTSDWAGNNSFETKIQVFDIAEQKELFSVSAEDNFPLECKITSSGFACVGNKYAAFYTTNGIIMGTYDYGSEKLYNFSLKSGGAVMLFKAEGFNSEYHSVVLNESGAVEYERTFSSTVFDVELCNEWSYYLIENTLICTDGFTVHEFAVHCADAGAVLLSFDDGAVYVCTYKSAPLYTVP